MIFENNIAISRLYTDLLKFFFKELMNVKIECIISV